VLYHINYLVFYGLYDYNLSFLVFYFFQYAGLQVINLELFVLVFYFYDKTAVFILLVCKYRYCRLLVFIL